jgi:hypothetical protein
MVASDDDDLCPLCAGPLGVGEPIDVCRGCAHGLAATGGIHVSRTAEFGAFTPGHGPAPGWAEASLQAGPIACAWCGKPQGQVKKLLSGGSVNICNECVALCADIMQAELGDGWRG